MDQTVCTRLVTSKDTAARLTTPDATMYVFFPLTAPIDMIIAAEA